MTEPEIGGWIQDLAALEALYGPVVEASTAKVSPVLTPSYRRLILASPFVALATAGPEGLDCSPRGDRGAALVIEDDRTLILPDRRGNNRIDSLRNIVRDPRVALLCLIPGSLTTVRINGTARLSADAALLERLSVEGQPPRLAIVIRLGEVYFQCGRAVLRAGLWDPAAAVDPGDIPTPGQILAEQSEARVGGLAYDAAWPARAAASLW